MASRGLGKPGGKTIQKPAINRAPGGAVRIKNAKQLRTAFVEVQQSPDGADPEPLTVPKCVECNHCGWPVYPRESKVATKKTFAKAGIERGTKKEEEAAKKEAEEKKRLAMLEGKDGEDGEGEEGEDGEGSHDSRDTVEKMADELEDLKDKNTELERDNIDLKEQVEDLTQKLQQTEEELEAAEAKIELLEEQDVRWREKLSAKRVEIEKLKTTLERASLVSNDREGGLIKTILELRDTRARFAAYRRRREFMLDNFEERIHAKEGERQGSTVLRFWRAFQQQEKLKRALEDTEKRRRLEVSELSEQVALERERCTDLRDTTMRLEKRLIQAGHRLLRRALSSDQQPGFVAHAFGCWVASHPCSTAENTLEQTQEELEEAQAELAEWPGKVEDMEAELQTTKDERDKLQTERDELFEELDFLKKDSNMSREAIEAKKQAERDKEAAHAKALADADQRFFEASEKWDEMREEMETQIGVLESRLAIAEAAAAAGGAGGGGLEDDDPSRICPKGQGTLCMGCLRQLVHRAVKPLPPMDAEAMTASAQRKAQKEFFEQELVGMPSPDDPLHKQVFNCKRDPYGLSRLTMYPMSAVRKSNPAQSPSMPDLHALTTGLPALKAKREAVSQFRSTMGEFRKELKPTFR
mmetsp:Transcript_51989/g.153311  ORF Transcript_51989/g.153311 Transcript_51989/m.153311 type:complete len:642 (+) Transcript_51989:95-2020(+)